MKTVYVLKYALTGGVVRADVLLESEGFLTVAWKGGINGRAMFSRRDCVSTEEEARAFFEGAKRKKQEKLAQQIQRLNLLKFNVTDNTVATGG